MASFKVGIKTSMDAVWTYNELRFETHEAARLYGEDLYMRWTAITEWQVEASSDAANRDEQGCIIHAASTTEGRNP
jgi:hypothetical protein